MDLLKMLSLDELAQGLANLPMFPYFELAHYIVSVMALRAQQGAMEVSRVSPLACWFSAMLFCFGGAVLSAIMMAEPAVAPLSNGSAILLATIVWYLVFYCPGDLLFLCAEVLPVRLVLTGMREVSRTWKMLGGVAMAHAKYKDSLLVMIANGLARGAGGGLIRNFEQLVRGVWRPETNELLRMTYPTKITLIGAVLFSLQQTQYLPVQKNHLLLLYIVFVIANGSRMMLTGSSASPFACVESVLYKTFFINFSPYAALTSDISGSCMDQSTSTSQVNGENRSLQAKDKSEKAGKKNN